MSNFIFVDANPLIYYTAENAVQHKEVLEVLSTITSGEYHLITSPYVVNEIHYFFLKIFGQEKASSLIKNIFKHVEIELIDLELTNKDISGILDLCVKYNLKTFDAYHALYCKKLKTSKILSFDTDFDRIPRLKRIYKKDML